MKLIILLIFCLTFKVSTFSQSWQVVGNMSSSVYGAQGIVKGSLIYILGGFSEPNNSATNNIQSYNPENNTWLEPSKMNSSRYDFIAGFYSDSIIYFGGVTTDLKNSSTLEIWNFNANPRIYATNDNFNRLFASGEIIDGNIYIFGGQAIDLPYLAIYDLANSTVIYTSNLSFNDQYPLQQMSVVVGNSIYLLGGINGVLINSIFKYNISDHSFIKLPTELERPMTGGAAVNVGDSTVYIIGGTDETEHALSSVEVLKFNNDQVNIEDGPRLNFPRTDPVVVNYKNSIFVFGGLGEDGQPVVAIERLDIVTGVEANKLTPQNFELENNYPNPFNPSTDITFKVGKTTKVSLDIYSVLGQHVRNITSKVFAPGSYIFSWNGLDDSGMPLSSGIYIYRLSSVYFTDAKKMILLK